jgi:hypothetical protein
MTENYTFVALVNILKLTALQILSLKAFIYIQEEWFGMSFFDIRILIFDIFKLFFNQMLILKYS